MARKKTLLETFYKQGYVIFEELDTVEKARYTLWAFIGVIDGKKLSLYKKLQGRVQFLKLSAMPVADDVENAFQGLHFDMGHPFVRKGLSTIYMLTGLYLPPSTNVSDGKTRVVRIAGLLEDKKWGGGSYIEKKLVTYARQFGDGWSSKRLGNTGRICCFAKVIDALGNKRTLPDYIDWFYDTSIDDESSNRKKEWQFYEQHGIDIRSLEEKISLSPGQMLLIDNTRMIHSRFGKRREKEMWQFLYGITDVRPGDMLLLRRYIVDELTSHISYVN